MMMRVEVAHWHVNTFPAALEHGSVGVEFEGDRSEGS